MAVDGQGRACRNAPRMSRRIISLAVLAVIAGLLPSCAENQYALNDSPYGECHKLAQEEGRLIKLLSTTLRAQHRADPDNEDVRARIEEAKAERRDVHHQRRDLGCI